MWEAVEDKTNKAKIAEIEERNKRGKECKERRKKSLENWQLRKRWLITLAFYKGYSVMNLSP